MAVPRLLFHFHTTLQIKKEFRLNKRITGGDILFASHTLAGTFFEDTLILIVENNEDGIFGLILNRPSRMPVSEVFNVELNTHITERVMYIGGPMDDDMLLTISIHDSPEQFRDGKALSETVEYGSRWENIEKIIESNEKTVRTFLGYTGWKESQLRDEIKEGSWTLYRGIETKKVLEDWYEPQFVKRRYIEGYLDSLSQE